MRQKILEVMNEKLHWCITLKQSELHVSNFQKGNKELKSNVLGQSTEVFVKNGTEYTAKRHSQHYLWISFLLAER